jgi:hypothetical protein
MGRAWFCQIGADATLQYRGRGGGVQTGIGVGFIESLWNRCVGPPIKPNCNSPGIPEIGTDRELVPIAVFHPSFPPLFFHKKYIAT